MSETHSGLVDIVEPAVPATVATGGWLWSAGIAAVLLLLALALFAWWRVKLPAYRALRQLRTVQRKMHKGELTPHEAVLLLALELRHGLGVKRLLADRVPEQIRPHDQARWAEFMGQLDALLYQHGAELGGDKLQAVFGQAEFWLRRYSRRTSLKKIGA